MILFVTSFTKKQNLSKPVRFSSQPFHKKSSDLQILQFAVRAFINSLNKDYFTSIILFFEPIPFSLKASMVK